MSRGSILQYRRRRAAYKITLYDNPWEKNAGVSSWKNGGVLISEDDPEYGVIAKKRTKMIDEYDIYLPFFINLMLQLVAAYTTTGSKGSYQDATCN